MKQLRVFATNHWLELRGTDFPIAKIEVSTFIMGYYLWTVHFGILGFTFGFGWERRYEV